MEMRRIVAIIRGSMLGPVEESLKQHGVKGITVSAVKGYGEYANLFREDWMVDNSRIEVFAKLDEVDAIVNAILETAHSGCTGDGLVAVMPVEKLYRIRTKGEMANEED